MVGVVVVVAKVVVMVVVVVVECLCDLQVQTQASGAWSDCWSNYARFLWKLCQQWTIYACTGKRYLGDTKQQMSDIR
jgi:hypothetical protein